MNGNCGRCQLLLNCVLWCVTQAVLISSVGGADEVIPTSASASTKTSSNDDASTPRLGIEALKPYSDLSHLPLEMTESELMSLTYYQGYSPKRMRGVTPVRYELRMYDKHVLIFTFEEKGGKCSGIQRVLDERWVLAPSSNLSWASARHDLAQTGVAGTKVSDKIAQRWDRKLHWLASSTSAGVNATAAIVGNHIYIPCESGDLMCLETQGGAEVWTYSSALKETPRARTPAFNASPAVSSDKVYLGDRDGIFHAVDRKTGMRRWVFKTEGAIGTAAAIVEGKVLFGSDDRHLYCLNADDAAVVWKLALEGLLAATPTVVDGQVLVSDGVHLRILDLASGRQKASFALPGQIVTPPVVIGESVYLGTKDIEVLALKLSSGQIVWRCRLKNEQGQLSAPAVTDALVIIGCGDQIHALDRETGTKINSWKFEGPIAGSPVVVANDFFVASGDGYLHRMQLPFSSRSRWLIGKPLNASPAVGEGVVAIGSADKEGPFVCLAAPERYALDPLLALIQAKLQIELENLDEAPAFDHDNRNDGASLRMRYKTRLYVETPKGQDGKESSPRIVEGPADGGIVLSIGLQPDGILNQFGYGASEETKDFKRQIYVHPIADSERQKVILISTRNTDEALVQRIKKILGE